MCLACWDTDERKELLNTAHCDGALTPFMTVEELKAKLVEKWHRTRQTSHVVYKDAIIGPPEHDLHWTETVNDTSVTLTAKFIHF